MSDMDSPETKDPSKVKELDAMPWRDGKKSGAFIPAEDCPAWLLNILKSTQKSYTLGEYDYKLSTTKPTEKYPEPKSFVWRYTRKDKQ